MKNLTFFFSFFLTFNLTLFAQIERCGKDIKLQERLKENPELANIIDLQNKQIANYTVNNKARAVITIPVVVHVVYNTSSQNVSDAQIYSQINVLNEDYRRLNSDAVNTPSVFSGVDTEIEFCLATSEPNGNPTTGITRTSTTYNEIGNTTRYYSTARGGKDIWNRDNYLNIWVCDLGPLYLGFAYAPNTAPSSYDGLVIDPRYFGTIGSAQAPYNKGRTATHEIGHWFNLEHLWGAGFGGCFSTDYVSDTPTQFEENYGCLNHPSPSCNNNGDMFMNYMDYSDDACMNAFTLGQKNRMIAAIQNFRPTLLTSAGCGTVGITSNELKESFKIYPTFTSESITIKSNGNAPYTYEIVNLMGQKQGTLKTINNPEVLLKVDNLSPGVYFISVSSNGARFTQKFIKIAP
ncbi:M43 family zinc metalloprotease [Vicingaceae bacterium]|jgi:hypothetical protein|nr:M43 family zinc metalloprotease [Vicingaceae bacterium]